MSKAEELLNSLDASNASEESHIVIGKDRFIIVPDALKRIAVQYDHDIETVTFDCPRYWDEHDMSTMAIYINYLCADNEPGFYKVKNVTVDPEDSAIMHFDWTISKNVTMSPGQIAFLVCVKNTDTDGIEKNHWNSEICKECYISEGIEYDGHINEIYPDIMAQWKQEVFAITDDFIASNKGIVAYSDDGIVYTATVPAITELTVGSSFVMIPSIESSTVNTCLNVNNFGVKSIKPRTTGSTGDFYIKAIRPDWITYNFPVRVTYNGHFWIADSLVVNAYDLDGVTEIEHGGTGATNIAQAAENLKVNSLAYASEFTDINDIDAEIPVGKYYINYGQYYTDNAEKSPLPFIDWEHCILIVEDLLGKGHVLSPDSYTTGAGFYLQTLINDYGEIFHRVIEYENGTKQGYTGWVQHYNSSHPIWLSNGSYGTRLPPEVGAHTGQVYFKKNDGLYIYEDTSGWVKYF